MKFQVATALTIALHGSLWPWQVKALRLADPASRLTFDDATADAGPSTGVPDSSLGVLSSKRVVAATLEKGDAAARRLQLQLEPTCAEYVRCFNGYEVYENGTYTNPNRTCATACLEDPSNASSTPLCCDGNKACEGFYGDVCRDGFSCSGNQACRNAKIGMVHHGCYGGERACESADGRVDKIVRGCNGTFACSFLGSDGGYVGVVEDSCHGVSACLAAGAGSGNITYIRQSCQEPYSCQGAARIGGFINGIEDACNFEKACYYAASPYKADEGAGDIPSGIRSCCNSEQKECAYANETSLPAECNTLSPTSSPTTSMPTSTPTSSPTTSTPTSMPTSSPTTSTPTSTPTTSAPTTSSPTLSPTSTPTSSPTCKIDATCGPDLCFNAIDASECPHGKREQLEFLFKVHHGCNAHVPMGGLCEADGECSTDNDLGNCKFKFRGRGVSWDVYRRVECC